MVSTDSPNLKRPTSTGTTRLTPSETQSLREDKKRASARMKELLAERKAKAANKAA